MREKTLIHRMGGILLLLSPFFSEAQGKDHPGNPAPPHAPAPPPIVHAPAPPPVVRAPAPPPVVHAPAPPPAVRALGPPPVVHAPAPPPIVHAPAPPPDVHYVPSPQAPIPSLPPSHRLQGQSHQAPINIPSPQVPSSMGVPSLTLPPLPSVTLGKKHQMPQMGSQFTGSMTTRRGSIFPSITTSSGGVFKPWVTRPSMGLGAQTPLTTSARGGRGRASFQTVGRRDLRRRGGFRGNFHRNFAFTHGFIPVILLFVSPYSAEPYDTGGYYINPYDVQQPYGFEDPYFFNEPGDIDFNIYINPFSAPPPQVDYTTDTDSDAPQSLDMQQIEALLQSVFQEMKIFDIPQFYN